MKKIWIILSFLILLKPVLPMVDYVMNYDYIAKVLCVNKAKPAMHCNGKCHLMKELAKASETEKPFSQDKKNSFPQIETLFFQEIDSFSWTCFLQNPQKENQAGANFYSHMHHCSVFHPPAHIS